MDGVDELWVCTLFLLCQTWCVTSEKLFCSFSFCPWATVIFMEALVITYTVCRSEMPCMQECAEKPRKSCMSALPVLNFGSFKCLIVSFASPWQKQKKLFNTLKQRYWPRNRNDPACNLNYWNGWEVLCCKHPDLDGCCQERTLCGTPQEATWWFKGRCSMRTVHSSLRMWYCCEITSNYYKMSWAVLISIFLTASQWQVLHVPQGLPFLCIHSLYHCCADDFSVFRTVIEWSESHDRGYVNLQSSDMEDYTFNDLSLKIGFPYLFCHQGDCEHIVIITDIR